MWVGKEINIGINLIVYVVNSSSRDFYVNVISDRFS